MLHWIHFVKGGSAHTFPGEWAELGNREMSLLELNGTDSAEYAGMWVSWYVLTAK